MCLTWSAHLVVKHVLILAALQHVLWKLNLHLLSTSSFLDLLLHIVVVPSQFTSQLGLQKEKVYSLEWERVGVEHLVLVGRDKSYERMTHLREINDFSVIVQFRYDGTQEQEQDAMDHLHNLFYQHKSLILQEERCELFEVGCRGWLVDVPYVTQIDNEVFEMDGCQRKSHLVRALMPRPPDPPSQFSPALL